MLTQDNMLNYAHRLVRDSAVMSAEEAVGIRIMTLVDRGFGVEMTLNFLEGDIKRAKQDLESTAALEAAVKHIEES